MTNFRSALLNVSPSLSALDPAHLLVSNPVLLGYRETRSRIGAYCSNYIRCDVALLCWPYFASKMPPRSPSLNAGDARPMDIVVGGNVRRRSIVRTYRKHLFVGQFRDASALAVRRSPLAHHINRILFVRSNPKVIGVAAGSVVAAMANDLALGDCSIGLLPCVTVSQVSLLVLLILAVAISQPVTLPFSAARDRWLRKSTPKSAFHEQEHTDTLGVRQ